jgi:anti-sigma factor RsiW
MKPNFEQFERQPNLNGETSQQQCFELLSAYLDGEVTPAQRRQVQQWLDTDPQIQQMYRGLLRLQQAIPRIPVPPSEISSQELSELVLQRVGRQRALRFVWGGLAAAAMVAGIFSSLSFRNESSFSQRVKVPQPAPEMESEPLLIALNQPVFDLPAQEKEQPERSN